MFSVVSSCPGNPPRDKLPFANSDRIPKTWYSCRPSPFGATVEDVPGACRQSLQLERMGTTTSAAVSAGCGGFMGTTSISSMGLTGTALQASGGGTTGLSRWQALVPYELLTKCTRRQVQGALDDSRIIGGRQLPLAG